MTYFLERKLKKLGHHADPDPQFLRVLEKRLRAQTGHPMWWVRGWKVAVGGLTAISLATSATSVYAYNSDDVLPDHPLYGLRTTIENVETSLATTPDAKARIQINHLVRRVKEQQMMVKKHKPVPTEVLTNIEKDLSSQIDNAATLATSTQEEIDTKLGEIKEKHVKMIRESSETHPDTVQKIEQINQKIDQLDAHRKEMIKKGEEQREESKADEAKTISKSESKQQELSKEDEHPDR